ncbi:MAG: S-adenosylmethionine/S-adenosylhomocysteine transporter [Chlamydiae bacterium]|nr:S-adenosylmethionine/S-adenosylhomocysteine transporter [Chlamydiota bacterium]
MTWLVVLLYATWSSVFAFGKVMLAYSTPLFLTGTRMLLAGALMAGYLAVRKRSSFRLNKTQWLSIGILALFSIFLTNILEFWGLQYLSAAKACFIYSLSPFFAALFSYMHFKERMTRSKWIGMLIGFLGMIPVFMTQTGSEELLSAFSFFTWPTLAIMGAALFSVYGWVILRLVVKNYEISPVMANGSSMLIGGAMALFSSFFIDSWNPVPIVAGSVTPFITGTLFMTVLYNIFCYNLYGMMLKRFTATFLSFMGLLSPIFASITGWLFLGEIPSWQIFLSTGIVSTGLWIVYRAELKQGYIKKSAVPTD